MSTDKFVTKNAEGKEVIYFLKKPTSKDRTDAKVYSNAVAVTLLNQKTPDGKSAFLFKSQVTSYLKEQGLWSDEKDEKLQTLSQEVRNLYRSLAKGGIRKSEAKDAALKIVKIKREQLNLISESRQLDQYTIESQVENASFDYLVSVCLLDENGEKVFSNVDEYKENADTVEVFSAVQKLASILYGVEDYTEKDEPEWKFLVKYGFANDKLQLINKDGHLVDELGHLINEEGRFVNEKNELIDIYGNLVDQEGNPIEEFVEFLED